MLDIRKRAEELAWKEFETTDYIVAELEKLAWKSIVMKK